MSATKILADLAKAVQMEGAGLPSFESTTLDPPLGEVKVLGIVPEEIHVGVQLMAYYVSRGEGDCANILMGLLVGIAVKDLAPNRLPGLFQYGFRKANGDSNAELVVQIGQPRSLSSDLARLQIRGNC